ncbi:MAG: FecR domain-containing protein [Novosphingobium sp.]|nr:FecR domain-containing protein [Novosphingobium sp.]
MPECAITFLASWLKNGARCLTPALAVIAIIPAHPAFAEAPAKVVGIAAAVVREVRIKTAAQSAFAPAKLRQRLAIADQVRTGAASHMQIALLDRTTVSIGANAQLTIDRFIYNPNGGSASLTAAKGALRFMSGPTRVNRSLSTPSATIGIRGTVFDVAVGEMAVAIAQRERAIPQSTRHDPATATLAVLRGPGPGSEGNVPPGAIDVAAGGETIALNQPLLAAYVPHAGATPIGPFAISLPGLAMLSDYILPPPPRREFDPASASHPVPRRDRAEPPWFLGVPNPGPDSTPAPGIDPQGSPGGFLPPRPTGTPELRPPNRQSSPAPPPTGQSSPDQGFP